MLKKSFILFLFLLTFIPIVKAKEERERPLQKIAQRDGGPAVNMCERMDERLAAKIAQLEENRDGHVNKYNRILTRLTEIMERMEDKGLDVSKLREDLGTFEVMVDEYVAEYKTFLTLLETAAGIDCQNAQEEFKEAMMAARAQMKVISAKRLDILEFYRDVLRVDIKDLREQAQELDN